jgi:FkbM family methyltransferase
MRNLIEDVKQRAFYIRRCLLGRDVWVKSSRKCRKERVGHDDGAWTLCTGSLDEHSVVYSLGLGWDISFDLDLIGRYGCKVFGFEPDPKAVAWLKTQDLPANFSFFPFGISGESGRFTFSHRPQNYAALSVDAPAEGCESFEAEVRTLGSVIAELGHEKIDVLKIDVEGAEFQLIDDLARYSNNIGQLLIEWHHRYIDDGVSKVRSSLQKLSNSGFEVTYVSPRGFEHSYINRNFAGAC